MTWPSLVSPGISYWWHITDLGSDASSVRKLYAHSSDIISWGTQWWDCDMYTQLCLCIRLLHINIIFHCYFTWDCFGNIFAMDWGQLIGHDQQWVLQWALFYNDHNQLFRLQIMRDTWGSITFVNKVLTEQNFHLQFCRVKAYYSQARSSIPH